MIRQMAETACLVEMDFSQAGSIRLSHIFFVNFGV